MTFKKYQSKPIERLAHRIDDNDIIQALPDCTFVINVDESDVFFKAYTTPVAGDYVVYLNDEDIYHCSAEVFHERNIVDDGESVPDRVEQVQSDLTAFKEEMYCQIEATSSAIRTLSNVVHSSN